MAQDETVIKTVADEIVEVVRKEKKLSVEDAAKKLGMSLPAAQAIVDFLVEEKIFGIEYKFTTPYIYLYKDQPTRTKMRESSLTAGLVTKEQFFAKAKEKNIPYDKIEGLWRKYLKANFIHIREEFLRKAREKDIPENKIDQLWEKYLTYL